MKIKIFMSAAILTALISCNNSAEKKEILNGNSNNFKIAQLIPLPAFATPITSTGEIRKFTLRESDNTTLDFNMTAVGQTLFGQKRTLIGFVKINGTAPQKAGMIIGKNAFELCYVNGQEMFYLKSKQKIDVGFNRPALNFDKTSKANFLAYASKRNTDGQALINNYNQIPEDNDSKFDDVKENGINYQLINITKTSLARQALEGKKVSNLESDYLAAPLNSSANRLSANAATALQNSRIQYNIDIIYHDANFSFSSNYFGIFIANTSIDPTELKLCAVPSLTDVSENYLNYNDSPNDKAARRFDYLNAFQKKIARWIKLFHYSNFFNNTHLANW